MLHLKRGDTISLYMGSGLLWFLGQGSAEAGLVDITTADSKTCSASSVQNWMKRHCQEYGFIWRYPGVKSDITGISNEDIAQRGVPKAQVCADIARMIAGNTLLLAYNAHFDLSFLYYLLMRHGDVSVLKGKDKLDLLTVYKDRHSYPHKLCNAIEVYGLAGKVVNSHRAIDDVLATVEVMKAMEAEKADLQCYVNLFGFNPKYGVSGKPIGSVTYKPQAFDPPAPLYVR